MSGIDEKDCGDVGDWDDWVLMPKMPKMPKVLALLDDEQVQTYLTTLAFLLCLFETIPHQPELARSAEKSEECVESILEISKYFQKFPSSDSYAFKHIRKNVLRLLRKLINDDLYGTNSPNTSLQDTVFNPNSPNPSVQNKAVKWFFGLFPKKEPKLTNDDKVQKVCNLIVVYYMRQFYVELKRPLSRWCGKGDIMIYD